MGRIDVSAEGVNGMGVERAGESCFNYQKIIKERMKSVARFSFQYLKWRGRLRPFRPRSVYCFPC